MFIRFAIAVTTGVLAVLASAGASSIDYGYPVETQTYGEGFYKTTLVTGSAHLYANVGTVWEISPAQQITTAAPPMTASRPAAVHNDDEVPGDSGGIPLPPSVWLLVSGLIGISVIARQRGRR